MDRFRLTPFLDFPVTATEGEIRSLESQGTRRVAEHHWESQWRQNHPQALLTDSLRQERMTNQEIPPVDDRMYH